jgi:hypothetical protein
MVQLRESRLKVDHRLDFRAELDRLESMIQDLKVSYEQYFMGIMMIAPDHLHKGVKTKIRDLRKAPFKKSTDTFRLRTLEQRYQLFNNYWTRVLREKEEGTYHKDIFKAELRTKHAMVDSLAEGIKGAVQKGMVDLFKTYKTALERQSPGRDTQELNFDKFQKQIIQRAKAFRKQHGEEKKKLTFKVVIKNGKVTVQAKAK